MNQFPASLPASASHAGKTRRALAIAASACALGLGLASPVSATIINFEADGFGKPVVLDPLWYENEIGEAYANLGAHFYNGYFKPCVAMACPAPAPGMIASSDDYAHALTIVFDGVTNFVSASNVTGSAWILSAFDMANVFIGMIDSEAFPETVELNLPGIHTISFQAKYADGLYAFDDLAFQVSDAVPPPPPVPTSVPEPGSLALMLAGLLALRRRTRGSER
jgi:hypothetical protein